MYARRGGAWLTVDWTEHAAGDKAIVRKPEARENLEAIPPSKLIHSMLMLAPFSHRRGTDECKVWGVHEFEGYAGPLEGEHPQTLLRPDGDDRGATIVVLDDAGNGFRDDTSKSQWPAAVKSGVPIMLYKVRRPLFSGALWEQLRAQHLGRTSLPGSLRSPGFRQVVWRDAGGQGKSGRRHREAGLQPIGVG